MRRRRKSRSRARAHASRGPRPPPSLPPSRARAHAPPLPIPPHRPHPPRRGRLRTRAGSGRAGARPRRKRAPRGRAAACGGARARAAFFFFFPWARRRRRQRRRFLCFLEARLDAPLCLGPRGRLPVRVGALGAGPGGGREGGLNGAAGCGQAGGRARAAGPGLRRRPRVKTPRLEARPGRGRTRQRRRWLQGGPGWAAWKPARPRVRVLAGAWGQKRAVRCNGGDPAPHSCAVAGPSMATIVGLGPGLEGGPAFLTRGRPPWKAFWGFGGHPRGTPRCGLHHRSQILGFQTTRPSWIDFFPLPLLPPPHLHHGFANVWL